MVKIYSEWWYPVEALALMLRVEDYLERQGEKVLKFNKNMSGPDFMVSFLNRYKASLLNRLCENMKKNKIVNS